MTDGLLAVTSLSRALSGQARRRRRRRADLDDRPAGPAVRGDGDLPAGRAHRSASPIRFAAGPNATALRGISRPNGSGIAGWVAVNRRAGGERGCRARSGHARRRDGTRARSCLAVPLIEGDVARRRPRALPRAAGLVLGGRPAAAGAARAAAGVVAPRTRPSPKKTLDDARRGRAAEPASRVTRRDVRLTAAQPDSEVHQAAQPRPRAFSSARRRSHA